MQDFWKLLPKKSVILSAKITKKENKCDIRVELARVFLRTKTPITFTNYI